MDAAAAAAQALEAYRVLRCGACLHTHAAAGALTPAHLSSLALAAQDLIAAYLGHASAPTPAAPAAPLSTCQPLPLYLAALPPSAAPLPLPVPPRPAPTAKDASLAQVIRDVERDVYRIGGALLQGAEAKFSGVLQACQAAAAAAAGAAADRLQQHPLALEEAMAFALQQGSRTTSGGDAYEATLRHLGLAPPAPGEPGQQQQQQQHPPLPLLLTADSSSQALPVALAFSPATVHHAAADPAAALHALRVLLQAHPQLLPSLPSSELEAAAAWACGLEAGVHIDITAATAYLLLLEGGQGEAAGAGEPRAVARLQAVYHQRLSYAAGSALLLPAAPGSTHITLCREPLHPR